MELYYRDYMGVIWGFIGVMIGMIEYNIGFYRGSGKENGNYRDYRDWRFPKIRGTFFGIPIIRTMAFWGWGPPIWETATSVF